MQHRTVLILTLLTAFAFSALFTGCSEDASSPLSNDEATAAASDEDYSIIAESIALELSDSEDGLMAMYNPLPPMETPGGGDPANPDDFCRDFNNLRDTTFTHGPFTTTIDVSFYDADNNPSEVYNPETSVRMNRELTMTGRHEDDRREVSVDLASTMDMANILAVDTIRVINDDGVRDESGWMLGRWEDQERTWEAHHEWQSDDVNVHVDHEEYPYPLSGQVHHYTEMEKTISMGNSTRTVTVEVGSTITFDGTEWALVEMDNGDEFYINLNNGGFHPHHRP